MLSINRDKGFFNYHINDNESEEIIEEYVKNLERFKDFRYKLYKKKYWIYLYYVHNENHKGDSFKVSDIKLKKPISSLTLADENNQIKEIKSLPKTLKVLWFQGFNHFGWTLSESVLPKSIISIYFKWSWNPLQGADLRQHKNLKIFIADKSKTSIIPKFPKSIVVISLANNPTLFYLGVNFKLADYPNLKYVNFKGSIDPKKVPREWRVAKKEGKIQIIW